MSQRTRLLKAIAATIADYRSDELASPTPEHIETWVGQFEDSVQEPMLLELNHVLDETYIPKTFVRGFLAKLLKNKDLAGEDYCAFWKNVQFLSIQNGGNSQREMLEMFDEVLKEKCELEVDECGGDDAVYLYLDDAIFTGNRVKTDLSTWILSGAPDRSIVHVVTIAHHRGGQYYADTGIRRVATEAGKRVTLKWWRAMEIEDRKAYIYSSDVLRPTKLPDDEQTRAYAEGLAYKPIFRKPGSVGENKFFSSEVGRSLLEQEFLKAGVRIRSQSPYLNEYQRPLGNMILATLGFGSTLVTFRNCPNNCPLAFWAGDPWYPLFARKTN